MRYLHLDVFTSTPFEGNQLAVFPDPGELSTAQMQTIAKEMNFSESTFIFPREGNGDMKMRIFTPGEELPIAGHPTIGSTFALAIEGAIERGRREFVFELGVGPTPVALEWDGDALAFAWMTQPRPAFGPIVTDRAALAGAIGVRDTDLATGLPAQLVSCGVPYVLVPMASRSAVDSVSVERHAFARCCRDAGLDETPGFFFTTATGSPEGTTYSRMIAPGLGIAEDPATGSAAGPLGSYLLHHRVVAPDAAREMVNLQGFAMGRPSRIYISIEGEPDDITRVRVGGKAVLVGRGELGERP
ncbi:MAG TPA: PhzF family phenazine biosynthesis protein [Vicinamibacterales bacterium]